MAPSEQAGSGWSYLSLWRPLGGRGIREAEGGEKHSALAEQLQLLTVPGTVAPTLRMMCAYTQCALSASP